MSRGYVTLSPRPYKGGWENISGVGVIVCSCWKGHFRNLDVENERE